MMKDEVINRIIDSDLIEPYDFIDLSYANARLNEIKDNKLHKQMTGGISPCIKTNVVNYGVVVYDKG
ncbi:MAG: hypothetical protein IJ593_07505 [Lachnospiraceae bacterium]|nr:hypothetical protein [Lachnospiraceae bacterium]